MDEELHFFSRFLFLIPLLFSLSVHEWAHAWMAMRLGDDTAKHLGRLTLNPFAHIDLIGTVIFPLIGAPIGWAKPVPVNPTRFRQGIRVKRGMMLVAGAGPLSNVFLAGLAWITLTCLTYINSQEGFQEGFSVLMQHLIWMNFSLVIFNCLPIPPLDGSKILEGIIPSTWNSLWLRYTEAGPLILLILVLVIQAFTSV